MKIGSQIKWVKYLSNIRSPRSLKQIERSRNRQKLRKDWSFQRKQSLGSLYQKELCNKPTPAELMFGNYLCEMGLMPFDFQRQILSPKLFILDFYIKRSFVAFEIDGESHLGQEDKDEDRDKILLINRGIKTYRFTNDEVLHDPNTTKARIIKAMSWE